MFELFQFFFDDYPTPRYEESTSAEASFASVNIAGNIPVPIVSITMTLVYNIFGSAVFPSAQAI